ncbi:twitching motility two-component system response regulator PilH [Halospina denitrificans]|uniref:Twitching motility two-component system response regulator PilH n=1 Tax=Halospina denitrificans TaxID=332522 RepID=A0A4R7JWN4_9GAMM|nr:response regulator [Halospina denitrificans]TDT41439.1 twitching motility two-component system response regulator PilH [Halospina denitrificans]
MSRVLIIDDSPTDRQKMAGVVKNLGFEVLDAENGADGVKKAREEQPDLILMDIIMPDINGFQATRQLSKDAATKDIPIIVVTTKDQETDRVWGMRQGASEFLVKPVDEKALASAIRKFMPAG